MIREYLGQVSTAATRKLPKGDRMLFVGRTRAAIEARVGPLASADADAVAAALTALGAPDDLAAKERERLFSARRRGAPAAQPTLWRPPGKTSRRDTQAAKPPRGGSGGSAGSPPRRSRPWPYRRSEPEGPALPGPETPDSGTSSGASNSGPAGSGTPGSGTGGSGTAGSGTAGSGTAGSGTAGSGTAAGGGTGSGSPGTEPAAPGRPVHIPAPRQPESSGPTVGPGAPRQAEPPGPTVGPGPPRQAEPPGPTVGPGTVGPGTVGPGAVGPGTAGPTDWLTSQGTVGPGVTPGAAGAGGHNGTAAPGASNGSAGAGTHNGTAGPGALNGTAHSGRNGTAPGVPAPGNQQGEPAAAAGAETSGPPAQPGAAPADGTSPLSIVPGLDTAGPAGDEPERRKFGTPAPLTEAWALARKNKLEAVAVIVLGVGGLLYPFPLWLIGGIVALRSRHWDKRDKWLALAGPPGFAVICLILLGISGDGSFFHAFAQATHQFGLLLRVGSVLCAGYLVWRLRRGPRRGKTPPWLRRG
jgi:hypothetical protein